MSSVNLAEVDEYKGELIEDCIYMDELEAALVKLNDLKADVQDPLFKVNLGAMEKKRPHL